MQWILEHRKISTVALMILFIVQQLIVGHVGDTMGVLISGIYVLGICFLGITLCRHKLNHAERQR